jgi:hypothetical protein
LRDTFGGKGIREFENRVKEKRGGNPIERYLWR